MEDSYGNGLTSIMHLPDDCLFFIFQRLNCTTDCESFGLTCHRWLHIQNLSRHSLQFQCSLNLLNPLSLFNAHHDASSFHLQRLLTRFQHLQFLCLSGCTELPDSGLTQLQHYGSKLQTLYLDCCYCITDLGLSLAATSCPLLVVISLYRCRITDVGLESLASACSALRHVNLSYCSLISDQGIRALSQGCRQLQTVRMAHCMGITGNGFRGCSSTLAHIEAEYCKLESEGIEAMVSGGGIEYLDFSAIGGCFRGDGFSGIGTGFASRLKILNLRMCRTVGDESIMAIAKGCLQLQEWNLALCHEIRTTGWECIGINCQNLEKLHVNRCRNLCDLGLQALRNGCQRLSVLYMSHCSKITTTAIELFKFYRFDVDIREEEVMCIGPKLAFRF